MLERLPWLKSYPPGIPATIDLSVLPTLNDLFEQTCQRHGEAVAFIQMGQPFTYAQLRRAAHSFSGWLYARGVREGDRVAVMLPNILQYPVVVAGLLRVGASLVSIGVLASGREVHAQLRDSGAVILVALEMGLDVDSIALDGTNLRQICVTGIGDLLPWPSSALVNHLTRRRGARRIYARVTVERFSDAFREGAGRPCAPATVRSEDVAVLQYTGGTTGLPKAAMLTHGNIAARYFNPLRGSASSRSRKGY